MRDGAEDGGINVWLFVLQSTPVGSLQTGHEMVVSPNRDRHPTASKVYISLLLYLKDVQNIQFAQVGGGEILSSGSGLFRVRYEEINKCEPPASSGNCVIYS